MMNEAQTVTLNELASRYPSLSGLTGDLARAAKMIADCFSRGGKLLLCGNGGSCADAEHIAGELMKGFLKKRPVSGETRKRLLELGEDGAVLADTLQEGLPAIPLDIAALSTAVINDLGGDLAFAQQVMALGREGDILFGISTSGNAWNVHCASLAARAKGMKVIGLTGGSGGRMAEDCDLTLVAPEKETYKIQELHLPIYHALCKMVEEEFYTV